MAMESPWSCAWPCWLDVLLPWFLPSSPGSAGAGVKRRSLVASGRRIRESYMVWLKSSKAVFIYKQSEHTFSISPMLFTKFSWRFIVSIRVTDVTSEMLFPFSFPLSFTVKCNLCTENAKTHLYSVKKQHIASPACFKSTHGVLHILHLTTVRICSQQINLRNNKIRKYVKLCVVFF